MSIDDWTGRNLATQGYRLGDAERRELRIGLRFSTGACLPLVVAALVLESAPFLFALSAIGALAGLTSRHPFDHVWNHAARHAVGAPPLPPNPTRRRHAFKIGTAWLLVVGALLAAGAATAALVLGGLLVAACATVTATNLCLPSETMSWLSRRRSGEKVVAA